MPYSKVRNEPALCVLSAAQSAPWLYAATAAAASPRNSPSHTPLCNCRLSLSLAGRARSLSAAINLFPRRPQKTSWFSQLKATDAASEKVFERADTAAGCGCASCRTQHVSAPKFEICAGVAEKTNLIMDLLTLESRSAASRDLSLTYVRLKLSGFQLNYRLWRRREKWDLRMLASTHRRS